MREAASNPNMSYLQLTHKAKEFEVQERMANGEPLEGLNAPVRRNNDRRNNDRRNNDRRNNGRDNNNTLRFNGDCRFCKRPGHMWRQCFLLLIARRPQNANHERMNARRDELLEQCTPAERQEYLEFTQRNNNNQNVGAAQAEAELAFPNQVDGRLAEPIAEGNALPIVKVNMDQLMQFMIKVFKVVVAVCMSCGGMIILLGVLMQAVPTQAATVHVSLPSHVAISANTPEAAQAVQAFPCTAASQRGVPWDSCAGLWLFNTKEPFHTWDANPKKYIVNGATGDAHSNGTGRASVGFDNGTSIEWFDNVYGVYVERLSESLAGATWSAQHLDISTVITKQGAYLELPSGSKVPLSLEGNVTRCRNIILGRNSAKAKCTTAQRTVAGTTAQRTTAQSSKGVTAKASAVVDESRGAPKDQRDEKLFASWTRKTCGLAPEALSHLHGASIGCPCPTEIPSQYRDLKWNASAVAGKLRASSHPPQGKVKTERFREYIAMDFLEFTIGGLKFHGQTFIDYHTGLADVRVTRRRSDAPRGLLRFLNWTDPFSSGINYVYCRSDNAKEFLGKEMKDVQLYSGVIEILTCPYEHEQNGKIERFNQTIQRMVIVMWHDSNVPEFITPYMVDFAVFVYNRVPVQSLDWMTRWEAATGSKPDARGWHRFGCLCRVLKPLELRKHKFDVHAQDCVYLGPAENGIHCYNLRDKKAVVRNDCVVYDAIMPFRSMGGSTAPLNVRKATAEEHSVFWDPDDLLTQEEINTGTANTFGTDPEVQAPNTTATVATFAAYAGKVYESCSVLHSPSVNLSASS